MPSAGRITINLSAGTAEFIADLDKANAKLRDFGASAKGIGGGARDSFRQISDGAHSSVSDLQATSAALRALEGGFTNSMRAGERFLASIKGIGPIVQSIFPLAGGAALLGIGYEAVEHIERAVEAFKKFRDEGNAATDAFRKLNEPLVITNEELAIGNDRLENAIAKLQGRPENNLKLAIHEAMLEADKFAESLDGAFTHLEKLLKENEVPWWGKALGREGNEDIEKSVKTIREHIGATNDQATHDRAQYLLNPGNTPEEQTASKKAVDAIDAQQYKDNTDYLKQQTTELDRQIARLRQIDAIYKELRSLQLSPGQAKLAPTPGQSAEQRSANIEKPASYADITLAGGAGFQRAQELSKQLDALGARGYGAETSRLPQLLGTRSTLEGLQVQQKEDRDKGSLQATQTQLEQAKDNPLRPFQDELDKLNAEITATRDNLEAVGKPEGFKIQAKAAADAALAIRKLEDDTRTKTPGLGIVSPGAVTVPSAGPVQGQITAAAQQANIPPALALAVAQQESQFNQHGKVGPQGQILPSPDVLTSSTGAQGIFQLEPGTAKDLGVDPRDAAENIQGGIKYLAQLYAKYQDWAKVLIAYNFGQAKVDSGAAVPASTQNYVSQILQRSGVGAPQDLSQLNLSSVTAAQGAQVAEIAGQSGITATPPATGLAAQEQAIDAQIRENTLRLESLRNEKEFQETFEKGSQAIKERIAALQRLTAAIGQGYAAQKAATVADQLEKEFGKKATDPEWLAKTNPVTGITHQAEVSQYQTALGSEYDTQQTERLTQANDKLSDQIELEHSLASAQAQGADAVRLVTLTYKLREAAQAEGLTETQKAIDAEIALANSEQRVVNLTTIEHAVRSENTAGNPQRQAAQANLGDIAAAGQAQDTTRIEARISQINQEIAATRNLTAAQVGGAEAVRQAQLQNRIAQIRRDVADPTEQRKEVTAVTGLSQAEEQEKIATDALRAGLAYQNQLDSIGKQLQYLQQVRATQGETLALDISIQKLEEERAKTWAAQVEVMGTARQGMQAYFAELATEGVSSAKQVHDAFQSAFESLNSNLAKMLAGQKVNWASFFGGLGEQLTKSSLKNIEANIASKFFPPSANPQQQGGIRQQIGNLLNPSRAAAGTHADAAGPKIPGVPHTGAVRDGQSASTALYVTGVSQFGAPSQESLPVRPAGTPTGGKPASTLAHAAEGGAAAETPRAGGTGLHAGTLPGTTPGSTVTGTRDNAGYTLTRDASGLIRREDAAQRVDSGSTTAADLAQGAANFARFLHPQGRSDGNAYSDQSGSATSSSAAQPPAQHNAFVSSLQKVNRAVFGGNGLQWQPIWRRQQQSNQSHPLAPVNRDGTLPANTPGATVTGTNDNAGFTLTRDTSGLIVRQPAVAGPQSLAPQPAGGNAFTDAEMPAGAAALADGRVPTGPQAAELAGSMGVPFAGFFASGGDVDSGEAAIVGENGPEMFMPQTDGTVIPVNQLKNFTQEGFDQTKSASTLFDVSLPTEAAGNQWMEFINVAKTAVSTIGKLASSSGGGGSDGGDDSDSSGSSDSGSEASEGDDQSNSGSSAAATTAAGGGGSSSSSGSSGGSISGGGGGLTGLITMGAGLALNIIGQVLSQKPDHHFKAGSPYTIPNFNGAFAAGGAVKSDKTHLVGEKGPELFVPKTDGQIIPNHELNSFAANGGGTQETAIKLATLKASSGRMPFGGYRAVGGSVDPSNAYMVGEQGPEIWTPPATGGSIVSNSQIGGTNGDIYIDARSADPALMDQKVRQGMAAANNAAVRTSFKSVQEYSKRTPQMSR